MFVRACEATGQSPRTGGVPGLLQHLDRLAAGLLGLAALPGPPLHPGQPPQAGAQRPQVAPGPVEVDHLPLRTGRPFRRADRVALDRELLEQVGPLVRGEPPVVLEHQREVGDGLAVRAGPGRVARGGRAVTHDGAGVTGLRRVVNNLGHVGSVPVDQGGEHPLVQVNQPGRWHRAGDGAPGELVAERDPAGGHGEQAAPLGRLERRHPAQGAIRHELVDQPALQRGRDDGQLLEHVLYRRVQPPDPGQDGVDDRVRNALTVR